MSRERHGCVPAGGAGPSGRGWCARHGATISAGAHTCFRTKGRSMKLCAATLADADARVAAWLDLQGYPDLRDAIAAGEHYEASDPV